MISFNLKSSFYIAIICFVSGFCLAFLLMGSCNDNTKNDSVAQMKQVKALKHQSDSITGIYEIKITDLENKNQQLQKELSKSKLRLNAIKNKTKQKADTIKKMIEPKGFPARELLNKADPSLAGTDSSLSPCDSLMQYVAEYLHDDEIKDSVYDDFIRSQDTIIHVKDSVIAIKTQEHNDVLLLFDKSIEQQEKLVAENKHLQKQFKRQKRKERLLAFGAAVLAGFAANYLLNH